MQFSHHIKISEIISTMVYYYTSNNMKMLKNIIIDYGSDNEASPYEFMKIYVGKCPEDIDDAKLSWTVETFLGFHKHRKFLKEIASHMSEEILEEDQDYFMIVFYAITFQIDPQDIQNLYKCLFNLSKPLLYIFTKFLSNNEVLTYLSQIAQASYDTDFITDKIIGPLFKWQPYISEMAHTYAEYAKKTECRKIKPPTVPVHLNVLYRQGKEKKTTSPRLKSPPPHTPPNSIRYKKKKMLTKSTIDVKLKQIHERNKQKATHLLKDIKSNDHHYTQNKTKKISYLSDDIEYQYNKNLQKQKATFSTKSITLPVKETAATIKRINRRIQLAEQKEVEWMQNLVNYCGNTSKLQQLTEFERQETERERLLDIEKKHLLGQISYEEAVLAKKKLVENNKKKYEEFMKERESWNEKIEDWKKQEEKKQQKQIEKLSLLELNVIHAKNGVGMKKKESAESLKKESDVLRQKAMKVRQRELERRTNMIKEIKLLAMITKAARVPKIIDLTETAGIGLLCEMSMAELQERLNAMKIGFKEELNRKRASIREETETAKQELTDTKNNIKQYMNEQAILRKQNKRPSLATERCSSKEIEDLKKILDEKRKLRMSISK